jgi:hypothetical protein
MAIKFLNTVQVDTDVLYVDASSNRVGIGTTTPSNPLHAYSSDNILATFESTDSISEIRIKDNTKYTRLLTVGGHFKIMPNDGVEMAVFQGETGNTLFNGGNVGIGTTSPTDKLHVSAGAIRLDNFYQLRWGGTGTGIYGHSTQGLNFYTDAGTTRLKIENGGNVGIGTTNPSAKLEVSAGVTTSVDIAHFSNSNNIAKAKISLSANSSGELSLIDGSNNTDVFITSNGNSYFNGGNVGIGTTAPGAKLVISGGGGAISDNGFQINSSYGFNGTGVLEINPSATSHIPLSILSKNGQTANLVNVTSFGGTAGNLFNVQSSGNVGIGTTSPSQKLEVAGSVVVTGTNVTVANASNPYIYINDTNAGAGIFQQEGNTTRIGSDSNTQVVLVQNNVTAVTIDTSRNVGIGTTSPVEKLHVDGKAFINGQIYGGFGAKTTTGTLDWNDSTNARSGNGHTLLRGNATNGPAGSEYYHPFSWEYGSYDNDGNMTQFAIPYSTNNTGMYYRSRYSGTWSDWAEIVTTTKTLPGGPYLPLSAGSGEILTGDLAMNNNIGIITKDSSGAFRDILKLNSSNVLEIGSSALNTNTIFKNTGNIGIGTTSPGKKLDINGEARVSSILTLNRVSAASLKFSRGSDFYLGINDSGDLKFLDDSASTLGIWKNSGNLGIGTTNPRSKLHVDGGVKIGDDTDTASADKVGTLKYRVSGNNSYVDMCMQTGATTYAWINIVQNNW